MILEVVVGIRIDEVGIRTKVEAALMVVVKIGIVYERFKIESLKKFAKILDSFGEGGWVGGIIWDEGGVDTCGRIEEVIGSKTNFCTCEVSSMSSSLGILSPQTLLIVLSFDSSLTTLGFGFLDLGFLCDLAFLGSTSTTKFSFSFHTNSLKNITSFSKCF